MKMSEFTYNLPEERIAKFPPKERGTTQLLVLDREEGSIKHRRYSDCVEYMREGDVIVLNETKVEKRRTYFLDNKERTHEVLFLNQQQNGNCFCLIKKSKQLNEKDILSNLVCKEIQLQIVKKSEKGVIVKLLSDLNPKEVFEKAGHTPIPPYMKRDDTEEDFERYNTVFGKYFGSVASPTASLNLTEDLLEKIKKKGIKIAKVELKVGWGTFAPVREENIEDHEIHEEEISLSQISATMPISCVISKIDILFLLTSCFNKLIIWACTVTSSAVVGSSAISIAGSHEIAIAINARWRIPPLNSKGYDFATRSGDAIPTCESAVNTCPWISVLLAPVCSLKASLIWLSIVNTGLR